MRRTTSRLFLGLTAAPILLLSASAAASSGKEACNNVELAGNGSCELVASGSCSAECTPLNLVAACDGQCDAEADSECTTACNETCVETCRVNPATFDCKSHCTTHCKAGCETSCSDSECATDCSADCDNRCVVKCTETPATETCETKCDTCCSASCQVTVNIDCHVDCTAELTGGCEVQCESDDGALFCDGQFVDADDLEACQDYLASRGFELQFQGHCEDGSCEATVTTSGCSAAPGQDGDTWIGVAAISSLVMGAGLVLARRRRRV